MKIVIGPILGFRGVRENKWHVCALIVVDGNETPTLSSGGSSATADDLYSFGNRTIWRFDWAVEQTEEPQTVDYSIGENSWQFVVPPNPSESKLRLAYASCNGFANGQDAKKVEDKNRLWKVMAQQHQERPYHLLLMGGDQVYGDPMWETVPTLKRWSDRSGKQRWKAKFTNEMNTQVERFYMKLYCSRWSQPEQAAIFARIPSLMMWDDHDIFDGWGSYPQEWHESSVYQGIFRHGRKFFSLFQMQATPNAYVINQLVSSAIVNVPPRGAAIWFYEKTGDNVEQVDRGITARMLTFPATNYRFIGKRNFLSLSLDGQRRIWADWFIEDEDDPFTKVIHPV